MRARAAAVTWSVAIAGGCGGGHDAASVPTIHVEQAALAEAQAAAPASSADAWRALSELVFSGGKAMLAAARGTAHDPRWNCEGSADADLRATTGGQRTLLEKAGARGDPVLYVLRGFELASPRKGDGRWMSVSADLVLWPNGSIRWHGVTTQGADVDELLPVAELPSALRGALTALTTELPTSACNLPSTSPGQLEGLLQVPDAARDEVTERLRHVHRGEHSACADLRDATGPWRIGARSLVVAVRGDTQVLRLGSEVRAPKGRVCLGHVVVDAGW